MAHSFQLDRMVFHGRQHPQHSKSRRGSESILRRQCTTSCCWFWRHGGCTTERAVPKRDASAARTLHCLVLRPSLNGRGRFFYARRFGLQSYTMAMFDMTAVSAALASIKALYDLVRNANDAQLALRISGEIANIQGRLIDVQQQALALQEENYRLNEELAQLQRSIEEEKLLDFKHGVYWRGYSVLTLEEDEEGNRISELR